MTSDDEDQSNLARAAMLLEASGLTPHDDELRRLAAAYTEQRRVIELLYDRTPDGEPVID